MEMAPCGRQSVSRLCFSIRPFTVSKPTASITDLATVFRRRYLVFRPKHLDEIRRRAETNALGNLGNREIRFHQQTPCPLHADSVQLRVQGPADGLLKANLQFTPRNRKVSNHVFDVDRFGRMVVNEAERTGDFGIVDGDNVRRPARDHVQRFGFQTHWLA